MANDEMIEIKYFNKQTLDSIIEKNISFSFNLMSSDSIVDNFKQAIIYLSKNNFDFKSKQIVVNLRVDDKYLNKAQLEKLKICEGLINLEGGRLAINDENNELWSIDNVIFANNRIDNAVEKINSLRVPDEGNRPLNNLEKLMMAYEICRSLTYHENDGNKMHARTITSVLNDGRDIVCVGYASLFQELCTRLNITCYKHYCQVGDSKQEEQRENHVNNVVVVNKKVFYLDVCWDSVKQGDSFGKYSFFMLPYTDKNQIKDKVRTTNEFGHISYPFVNILEDKKNLNLAAMAPENEALAPELKKVLVDINLKYSHAIKDTDYFDESSSDLEIRQACKKLLGELNKYQLDYAIPLDVLEKSLYNLNRACGSSKENADIVAKQTIAYNVARAGEMFNQNGINAFNEARNAQQDVGQQQV